MERRDFIRDVELDAGNGAQVIWGKDLMRLTLAGMRVSAIETRQG